MDFEIASKNDVAIIRWAIAQARAQKERTSLNYDNIFQYLIIKPNLEKFKNSQKPHIFII